MDFFGTVENNCLPFAIVILIVKDCSAVLRMTNVITVSLGCKKATYFKAPF